MRNIAAAPVDLLLRLSLSGLLLRFNQSIFIYNMQFYVHLYINKPAGNGVNKWITKKVKLDSTIIA